MSSTQQPDRDPTTRGSGTRPGLLVTLTVVGALTPLIVSLIGGVVAPEHGNTVIIGGLAAMWVFAIAVLVLLRRAPRTPVRPTLRLTWADLGIAVAVGVAAALLVPVLTLGATLVLGETGLATTAGQASVPILALSILTAAVTEEVLYRASPIELLRERRAPGWLVFALPWAVFVVAHLGSWSLAHIIGVVVPLGALMTGLYLWRRNLTVNIIAHAIIDAPLLVLALTAAPAA